MNSAVLKNISWLVASLILAGPLVFLNGPQMIVCHQQNLSPPTGQSVPDASVAECSNHTSCSHSSSAHTCLWTTYGEPGGSR